MRKLLSMYCMVSLLQHSIHTPVTSDALGYLPLMPLPQTLTNNEPNTYSLHIHTHTVCVCHTTPCVCVSHHTLCVCHTTPCVCVCYTLCVCVCVAVCVGCDVLPHLSSESMPGVR
jgi:hypothetical protein